MERNKIAILCGGHGKRLRPTTSKIPKALVELDGRPIIDYIIELYINKGINDLILCTGYKSKMIEGYVKEHFSNKCQISISNSGNDAGMLQRIFNIKDLFDDRIIVSYGDTLTDLDLEGMTQSHIESKALITIATLKIKSPFGLVGYGPNGHIESFQEKPVQHYYIGHFLLEKESFNFLDEFLLEMPDGNGLVAFFQRIASINRLNGFEHQGFQITFNTEDEFKTAEHKLKRFFTIKEGNDNEDKR